MEIPRHKQTAYSSTWHTQKTTESPEAKWDKYLLTLILSEMTILHSVIYCYLRKPYLVVFSKTKLRRTKRKQEYLFQIQFEFMSEELRCVHSEIAEKEKFNELFTHFRVPLIWK